MTIKPSNFNLTPIGSTHSKTDVAVTIAKILILIGVSITIIKTHTRNLNPCLFSRELVTIKNEFLKKFQNVIWSVLVVTDLGLGDGIKRLRPSPFFFTPVFKSKIKNRIL